MASSNHTCRPIDNTIDLHKNVIQIQSCWRGYYVRQKFMPWLLHENELHTKWPIRRVMQLFIKYQDTLNKKENTRIRELQISRERRKRFRSLVGIALHQHRGHGFRTLFQRKQSIKTSTLLQDDSSNSFPSESKCITQNSARRAISDPDKIQLADINDLSVLGEIQPASLSNTNTLIQFPAPDLGFGFSDGINEGWWFVFAKICGILSHDVTFSQLRRYFAMFAVPAPTACSLLCLERNCFERINAKGKLPYGRIDELLQSISATTAQIDNFYQNLPNECIAKGLSIQDVRNTWNQVTTNIATSSVAKVSDDLSACVLTCNGLQNILQQVALIHYPPSPQCVCSACLQQRNDNDYYFHSTHTIIHGPETSNNIDSRHQQHALYMLWQYHVLPSIERLQNHSTELLLRTPFVRLLLSTQVRHELCMAEAPLRNLYEIYANDTMAKDIHSSDKDCSDAPELEHDKNLNMDGNCQHPILRFLSRSNTTELASSNSSNSGLGTNGTSKCNTQLSYQQFWSFLVDFSIIPDLLDSPCRPIRRRRMSSISSSSSVAACAIDTIQHFTTDHPTKQLHHFVREARSGSLYSSTIVPVSDALNSIECKHQYSTLLPETSILKLDCRVCCRKHWTLSKQHIAGIQLAYSIWGSSEGGALLGSQLFKFLDTLGIHLAPYLTPCTYYLYALAAEDRSLRLDEIQNAILNAENLHYEFRRRTIDFSEFLLTLALIADESLQKPPHSTQLHTDAKSYTRVSYFLHNVIAPLYTQLLKHDFASIHRSVMFIQDTELPQIKNRVYTRLDTMFQRYAETFSADVTQLDTAGSNNSDSHPILLLNWSKFATIVKHLRVFRSLLSVDVKRVFDEIKGSTYRPTDSASRQHRQPFVSNTTTGTKPHHTVKHSQLNDGITSSQFNDAIHNLIVEAFLRGQRRSGARDIRAFTQAVSISTSWTPESIAYRVLDYRLTLMLEIYRPMTLFRPRSKDAEVLYRRLAEKGSMYHTESALLERFQHRRDGFHSQCQMIQHAIIDKSGILVNTDIAQANEYKELNLSDATSLIQLADEKMKNMVSETDVSSNPLVDERSLDQPFDVSPITDTFSTGSSSSFQKPHSDLRSIASTTSIESNFESDDEQHLKEIVVGTEAWRHRQWNRLRTYDSNQPLRNIHNLILYNTNVFECLYGINTNVSWSGGSALLWNAIVGSHSSDMHKFVRNSSRLLPASALVRALRKHSWSYQNHAQPSYVHDRIVRALCELFSAHALSKSAMFQRAKGAILAVNSFASMIRKQPDEQEKDNVTPAPPSPIYVPAHQARLSSRLENALEFTNPTRSTRKGKFGDATKRGLRRSSMANIQPEVPRFEQTKFRKRRMSMNDSLLHGRTLQKDESTSQQAPNVSQSLNVSTDLPVKQSTSRGPTQRVTFVQPNVSDGPVIPTTAKQRGYQRFRTYRALERLIHTQHPIIGEGVDVEDVRSVVRYALQGNHMKLHKVHGKIISGSPSSMQNRRKSVDALTHKSAWDTFHSSSRFHGKSLMTEPATVAKLLEEHSQMRKVADADRQRRKKLADALWAPSTPGGGKESQHVTKHQTVPAKKGQARKVSSVFWSSRDTMMELDEGTKASYDHKNMYKYVTPKSPRKCAKANGTPSPRRQNIVSTNAKISPRRDIKSVNLKSHSKQLEQYYRDIIRNIISSRPVPTQLLKDTDNLFRQNNSPST